MKKPIPKGLATDVLESVINGRLQAVRNNPNLKITNRWDQSDCFYNTRKKLDARGYDVSIFADRDKRKELTRHIKAYCDRLGIKRHDIGIFAADRAVMAYRGRSYSVSFENYKGLAQLGTDIICVEKEGIVDKLVPFTTNFGIALLQSQGFLSEFGEMLAHEAAEYGARVGMLTDFDSSGVDLAFTINDVTRFGVGLDTIDEINAQRGDNDEILDPLNLLENYKQNNHWLSLNYLSQGISKPRSRHKISEIEGTDHELEYQFYLNKEYEFSDGTTQTYIEFIKDRRIELNTIVDEIGAERFWNWLKSKVLQIFPDRNYNRAIDVPDYVPTPTMTEFQQKLRQSVAKIASPMVNTIEVDLVDTEGLLDVKDKESEIEQELLDNLLDEPKIQKIDGMLKQLIKKLD